MSGLSKSKGFIAEIAWVLFITLYMVKFSHVQFSQQMSTYLNCNRKINPFFVGRLQAEELDAIFHGIGSVKYFLASMKCYSNQKFYYYCCTSSAFLSLCVIALTYLIFKFRTKTEMWFWFYSHICKNLLCRYYCIFERFFKGKKVQAFSPHTFEQVNLKNKEKKIFH